MLAEFYWWLRRRPTPRDIWHEVKWAIQRVRRGWSDRDNWSMYDHLSIVMADMLKQLRETGVGYHCVHGAMGSEVRGEHMLDSDKCAPEDWWALLQRIEFGLRYYEYVYDGDCCLDYSFDVWLAMMDSSEEVIKQTFADLGEYWGGMWD